MKAALAVIHPEDVLTIKDILIHLYVMYTYAYLIHVGLGKVF